MKVILKLSHLIFNVFITGGPNLVTLFWTTEMDVASTFEIVGVLLF